MGCAGKGQTPLPSAQQSRSCSVRQRSLPRHLSLAAAAKPALADCQTVPAEHPRNRPYIQRSSMGDRPTHSPHNTSLRNTSCHFCQRKCPCAHTLRTSIVAGYSGSGTRAGYASRRGAHYRLAWRVPRFRPRLSCGRTSLYFWRKFSKSYVLAPNDPGRVGIDTSSFWVRSLSLVPSALLRLSRL